MANTELKLDLGLSQECHEKMVPPQLKAVSSVLAEVQAATGEEPWSQANATGTGHPWDAEIMGCQPWLFGRRSLRFLS